MNGTVRWTGELPLEGDDPKKKIPVYGLETVSFLFQECLYIVFIITEFKLCILLLLIHVQVYGICLHSLLFVYSRSHCMC